MCIITLFNKLKTIMPQILTKTEAEIKLMTSLPTDLIILATIFKHARMKLFLVGGCIRDAFMGKTPHDFDVCTNAMPETVVKILEKNGIPFNIQGAQFGVVVAHMPEGQFEIATFRVDSKIEGNNRHPEVRLGVTIQEDCMRRDFTINAMFMDLEEQKIIDFVGGIQDLTEGVVRCVGNPDDRFDEDHLRKVRAVIRAVKDGFDIHPDTFDSIFKSPTLNIHSERIVIELIKTDNFESLLCMLFQTGLVHEIFSGFLINTFDGIRLSRVTSFNSMIACIISKHDTDVAKKLLDKNFTAKTASSVEFLHNLKMLPTVFHAKRKQTKLTDEEIIQFHDETFAVKWLIKFIPDPVVTANLIEQGFVGKELGEQIKQIHVKAFLDAIVLEMK